MTEKELAEVEARADAATAGPWVWEANIHTRSLLLRDARHNTVLDFVRWGMGSAQARLNVGGIMHPLVEMLRTPQAHNAWRREGIDHPDAVFMEHANVDVKRLIADLRAARALLSRLLAWDENSDSEPDTLWVEVGKYIEETRAALPPEEP